MRGVGKETRHEMGLANPAAMSCSEADIRPLKPAAVDNVEPDSFRDWLRDSDNLADFVRVYVAHIAQHCTAASLARRHL